ncbi:hypothetical protein QCA50_014204 [Cerrena zonata]|uniref:ABC transmembrane type-1 domain-containing protein n=1 Tax=Cerrena zonata TaxID=2478898 RepID=A0AAW0FVC1_9APHY
MATHALHVLDKTDYIYVMDNGVIVEQGTYRELMNDNGLFSRIIDEYGSQEKVEEKSEAEITVTEGKLAAGVPENSEAKKVQAALMQAEERLTGSVASGVYLRYFRYAGGAVLLPSVIALLAAYQGATVANNLFLGFWTSQSIHGFSQGDYMGTYAGLGVGIAVFSFILSFSMSIITIRAGLRLFRTALFSVLRSPISFFDTTYAYGPNHVKVVKRSRYVGY